MSYLQLIAFMYFMPSATNIIQGFFRGLGDLKVTLISTILNMSARFLSAWIMIHILGGGFDSTVSGNAERSCACGIGCGAPCSGVRLADMRDADTACAKCFAAYRYSGENSTFCKKNSNYLFHFSQEGYKIKTVSVRCGRRQCEVVKCPKGRCRGLPNSQCLHS